MTLLVSGSICKHWYVPLLTQLSTKGLGVEALNHFKPLTVLVCLHFYNLIQEKIIQGKVKSIIETRTPLPPSPHATPRKTQTTRGFSLRQNLLLEKGWVSFAWCHWKYNNLRITLLSEYRNCLSEYLKINWLKCFHLNDRKTC